MSQKISVSNTQLFSTLNDFWRTRDAEDWTNDDEKPFIPLQEYISFENTLYIKIENGYFKW